MGLGADFVESLAFQILRLEGDPRVIPSRRRLAQAYLASGAGGMRETCAVPRHRSGGFSFARSGLAHFPFYPTACAVGCILSPLRGWDRTTSVLENLVRTHTLKSLAALTSAVPLRSAFSSK